MVFFVDAEDHATKIFNTQRGTVLDGTALFVSFPERMIGSDGHIWNSREPSPQEFLVTQATPPSLLSRMNLTTGWHARQASAELTAR